MHFNAVTVMRAPASINPHYREKIMELIDNVVQGILQGIKFMLLNPQYAELLGAR